jgi:hypothetical protein
MSSWFSNIDLFDSSDWIWSWKDYFDWTDRCRNQPLDNTLGSFGELQGLAELVCRLLRNGREIQGLLELGRALTKLLEAEGRPLILCRQQTSSLSWSDFIKQILTLVLLVWHRLYQEIVFRCSYSEFSQRRRPPCTTMPWSIWPPLMVLWGVCWMFYPSPTPQGTGCVSMESVHDHSPRLSTYIGAIIGTDRGQIGYEMESRTLDSLFGLDPRKYSHLL